MPLYWALIHDVDPIETLMYRIVLSLIFMLLLLPIIGQWQKAADTDQYKPNAAAELNEIHTIIIGEIIIII
ncbi:hypothetical protein QS430_11155 [Staphylococcus pseudintermedius]|nr:hypothetical protein QS430_11155 [Staphylococcus pseudintermedius]